MSLHTQKTDFVSKKTIIWLTTPFDLPSDDDQTIPRRTMIFPHWQQIQRDALSPGPQVQSAASHISQVEVKLARNPTASR